jgi:hypothetical protein
MIKQLEDHGLVLAGVARNNAFHFQVWSGANPFKPGRLFKEGMVAGKERWKRSLALVSLCSVSSGGTLYQLLAEPCTNVNQKR